MPLTMRFFASVSLSLFSLQTLAAGDIGKGKELFAKKCVACHGKNAEGNKSQKAPKLAGQYDWYVVKQLHDFKSEIRKNPKMLPFIKNLTEQDFQDLAAYLNSLPH